ncbi:MAG: hypothetical protein QM658_00605 [Gordonia sp. (in: high G+C Gram-positive bacteria)]
MSIVAGAVVLSTAAALTGCSHDDAPLPLTSLVLAGDALPVGYSVVPAAVDDMVDANKATLAQATTVSFDPAECKPTADAEFNPQLTSDNTVLLVGQSDSAVLSEVVSTVVRDVDADRRATTGPCRVVAATPSKGTLAGARIVTTTDELKSPADKSVEQALVVRQNSVTTLVDGGVRSTVILLATVLVHRPGGSTVTLQLSVGTSGGQVTPAGQTPPQAAPPMSDGEFSELVDKAVARAAR